jgi:hypothetical protein
VEGKRQRGRPKLRWEDGVMDGARTLGQKNWRNAARNKDAGRKLLRKTCQLKQGCCDDDDDYGKTIFI